MSKPGKHGQEHKPATISNFQRGIIRQNVIERAWYIFEWFSQQLTLTFLYPYFALRKLKYSGAGSTETIFRISANCSCWDFWQIPLQVVLEALFIFNMIYVHWIWFQTRGSLFLLASSKNTRRKPFEFKWPEMRFNRKQASITGVCHIINYLLT